MMNGLTKIRLSGWKSIREVELPIGPLNVLIGANGSGKSNFISYFKFLNEMSEGRLQEHIARVGGADSLLYYGAKQTPIIEAELHFTALSDNKTYYQRLAHTANDTLIFVDEKVSLDLPPMTDAALNVKGSNVTGQRESILLASKWFKDRKELQILSRLIKSCRLYHFHDTSAESPLRLPGFIEENTHIRSDARNLAAVLYRFQQVLELRPVYDRIVSTVAQINPRFGNFVLEPRALNPSQILLNWREKGRDYLFGPHQLSDGTLRVMALATLLLQPENELPSVMVIDEPELGLHPYAIGVLAALLRKVSHHSQVIVSTQSAELLNHFEPDEVIVVNRKGEESEFRRLSASELDAWLDDYTLGELWEKNVLGGGPH
jgi:predicted ATPase